MEEGFSYYLAGLIDGEGSFLISIVETKHKTFTVSLRVKISSTSKELLEKIQQKTGIGRIYSYNLKNRPINYSEAWGWYTNSFKEIKSIVLDLDNKLILKQKEFNVVKEVIEIIENKRNTSKIIGLWSKDAILKIAGLRDTIQRRKDRHYKNLEYFKNWFENK